MADVTSSLPAGAKDQSASSPPVWPAKLLIVCLAIPFFFPIGPLFLTADRFILLALILPCLTIWASGKAGPIHAADIMVLLLCLWSALSMFVIDGPSIAVEGAGIAFLETFGAYLVARCFVRDADAFHSVVRFLFWFVLLMLPFAIHETLTSRNGLLSIANSIWPSYADVPKEPRWGLDRVALTFYHPILFGVFCGSAFALTYYVLGYQASKFLGFVRTSTVGLMTFLSLSSGPITALVAQLGLILWDKILGRFPRRWVFLSAGVIFLWILAEIAANRSVPELFLTYFAFNPGTAYNRLRIWEFGTMSIANHPLLGIGLTGDWVRPWWMSGSMDMFWIVSAVQHGLPAGIFLHLAFIVMVLSVAFKSNLDDRSSSYRTGYLICMMGFYLAGWTVHYWKVIYVLFMFFLGCGAWIIFHKTDENETPTDAGRDTAPHQPLIAQSDMEPARRPRGKRVNSRLLYARDFGERDTANVTPLVPVEASQADTPDTAEEPATLRPRAKRVNSRLLYARDLSGGEDALSERIAEFEAQRPANVPPEEIERKPSKRGKRVNSRLLYARDLGQTSDDIAKPDQRPGTRDED